METMTAAATDQRIEELAKTVDHRFDRVEGDVREIRSEMHGLRSDLKSGNDLLRAGIKTGDDASARRSFPFEQRRKPATTRYARRSCLCASR